MNVAEKYTFYKGRVALFALLKAFGICSGDRVLMPSYTCIVVPFAIKYTGAIPEYTDIDPQSYNASLPRYQEAYSRLTEQGTVDTLRAVIIQHTYGNQNSDTKRIVDWAHQHGLFVFEDCAHVNGVTIDKKPVGSFGDGAFFSTQWSKPFTTGLGGIAQLNRPEYSSAMQSVADVAQTPGFKESTMLAIQLAVYQILLAYPRLYWLAINSHRFLAKKGVFVGSSGIDELKGEMPKDYLKRMGLLQAWLLTGRERRMRQINSYRKGLTEEYDQLLLTKGIPPFEHEQSAVLIRYPFRVTDKAQCLRAAKLNGIELGDWFDHPLHPAGSCLDGLNWNNNLCPQAVLAASETVNLPVHSNITPREAARIVNFVADFAKR